MLVLFETPAGYALFRLQDEGKLKHPEKLFNYFQDLDSSKRLLTLADFQKFSDTAEALASTTAIIESQVDATLENFLKKQKGLRKEKLAVADKRLGTAIREKFPDCECVNDKSVLELFRCIRFSLNDLLFKDGFTNADMQSMSLGLSHSLGRYKLKFSPDKVDVMIVQAISLLDDLDKEINTYAMRVKEWYGWHFPELTRIIADNLAYARLIKFMGLRTNAETLDLSDVLPEDEAAMVKQAAQISMGTEISDEDVKNIKDLCGQLLEIADYRDELHEYIKNRMRAIAPNLTILVGELVGARLIAHAGSLLNLAKHPASTVQILGAEKALFRALKSKKATPKYGLIYHASLVGQATIKNKGKISRILANKAVLSCRVDALGEEENKEIGEADLRKVQARLQQLDGRTSVPATPTPPVKYVKPTESPGAYNASDDTALKSSDGEKSKKRKRENEDQEDNGSEPKKKKQKQQ